MPSLQLGSRLAVWGHSAASLAPAATLQKQPAVTLLLWTDGRGIRSSWWIERCSSRAMLGPRAFGRGGRVYADMISARMQMRPMSKSSATMLHRAMNKKKRRGGKGKGRPQCNGDKRKTSHCLPHTTTTHADDHLRFGPTDRATRGSAEDSHWEWSRGLLANISKETKMLESSGISGELFVQIAGFANYFVIFCLYTMSTTVSSKGL